MYIRCKKGDCFSQSDSRETRHQTSRGKVRRCAFDNDDEEDDDNNDEDDDGFDGIDSRNERPIIGDPPMNHTPFYEGQLQPGEVSQISNVFDPLPIETIEI